jgi:hypothetical protein
MRKEEIVRALSLFISLSAQSFCIVPCVPLDAFPFYRDSIFMHVIIQILDYFFQGDLYFWTLILSRWFSGANGYIPRDKF